MASWHHGLQSWACRYDAGSERSWIVGDHEDHRSIQRAVVWLRVDELLFGVPGGCRGLQQLSTVLRSASLGSAVVQVANEGTDAHRCKDSPEKDTDCIGR